MTAKIAYANSMNDEWFDADMQSDLANRIRFNVTKCAQLWERLEEGKRRD